MKIDVAGGSMRNVFLAVIAMIVAGLSMSCEQGIDEDNSSAKVSGYVYRSHSDPTGVQGVKVIIESDVNSENPYNGPDRWFETNENGYFEGYMFLGSNEDTGEYNYVADFLIQYFYNDTPLGVSTGGITLAPGSSFTMPPRYLNQ